MYLIGAIDLVRACLLFVTQMIAAIAAAGIVSALFTGGLNVSTTLATTTTVAQGTIIEMLLTMSLVFTIFMLAAEKHTGNFIAPVGIGLSLFVAELTGKLTTPTLQKIAKRQKLTMYRRLLDRRFLEPSTILRARRRC